MCRLDVLAHQLSELFAQGLTRILHASGVAPGRAAFNAPRERLRKNSRWENFNKKHNRRFEFVYTPIHASWVNQIEQWFSVLQRRLLRHGSFEHVGHLKDRVEGFIRWWNLNDRKPTRWTFDGNFSHYGQRAA